MHNYPDDTYHDAAAAYKEAMARALGDEPDKGEKSDDTHEDAVAAYKEVMARAARAEVGSDETAPATFDYSYAAYKEAMVRAGLERAWQPRDRDAKGRFKPKGCPAKRPRDAAPIGAMALKWAWALLLISLLTSGPMDTPHPSTYDGTAPAYE